METTEKEPAQDQQNRDILNVKEAAAYMRCSVSAVYRDSALGVIPCIRKGRRVLFLKSDLLTWLETMRTSTESAGAGA